MFDWPPEVWSAVATVVLAGVAVLQMVATARQSSAMIKQADALRGATERQLRPLVVAMPSGRTGIDHHEGGLAYPST